MAAKISGCGIIDGIIYSDFKMESYIEPQVLEWVQTNAFNIQC